MIGPALTTFFFSVQFSLSHTHSLSSSLSRCALNSRANRVSSSMVISIADSRILKFHVILPEKQGGKEFGCRKIRGRYIRPSPDGFRRPTEGKKKKMGNGWGRGGGQRKSQSEGADTREASMRRDTAPRQPIVD